MSHVLPRDTFRALVFKRDGNKCVLCGAPGQDAHHILERRLWPDGGYYLNNGATLCGPCHLLAEATTVSCAKIREAASIEERLLPPHFYKDNIYDKWGNIISPRDEWIRYKGELADDESVKKVIDHRVTYSPLVKYPRTYHMPWSPGVTKDDRVLQNMDHFKNRMVVVTEKLDGENTTMYRDHIHARSLDSDNHPTRNWVKGLWGQIRNDIPEGWRLCGENLYAKHSIAYDSLPSYFILFSIWNEQNVCLSWPETEFWAVLLNLKTPPMVYRGMYDEEMIRWCGEMHDSAYGDEREGYVLRLEESFHYKDFRTSVAKYVRENHVQTHGHWMRNIPTPNGLAK